MNDAAENTEARMAAGNEGLGWRLETDISGFRVRRSEPAARGYLQAGHWTDRTLADVAIAQVTEDPSRVLVIEGAIRLTRAEAWDQALRLSSFFKARGLRPGDVVSYQLPNWVETCVISLAARISGLVINPLPVIYRETEVSYILGDCGSKMIFIPETFRGFDHRGLLERIRPQAPALRDVVVVRSGDHGGLSWKDALDCEPSGELPAIDPAAVMMVMYTSGTTSRPKGVLHSHQTYGFKVRHMADTWRICDTDVAFMPSPMSHITGAFWGVDLPWERGASAVLMDVWSAEEGLRCIETHQCTVTAGATPFLQQVLELGKTRPEAVRSLRLFSCGGTTVSPDLIRKASATFGSTRFFRAYGSTEAPTTSMGGFDGATLQLNAETDGAILPPTEVKIVSDAGDVLGEDKEGEILVRGPEVFLGYLNAPNGDDFDDEGYFRTGDLGRRVHGRHLVITGRKKDVIIRAGENISPKEVEDILQEHPDIMEVAIVAMPSPATGEKGCAFIVPRAGAQIDLGMLRTFLEAAKVARQKFPEHIVLVDELPHVPLGKVRKDVLRAEAKRIAATL